MKILITGIAGFVGGHLAQHCLSQGCEVHGFDRLDAAKHVPEHLQSKVNLHDADLKDYAGLLSLLYKVQPDRIFHLAAQSYVPLSWKSPQDTFHINVIGQANLFEAVRELGLKPRILIVGSSEEYGLVKPNEVPIREENPLRPLSPYAVSKVAQDLMAFQYARGYQMQIIRTRAFNHTGPRRGEFFVSSNFAKQIAMIEAGLQKNVIYVGNLEAVRDFSDVRDIVRAYWLALEMGEPGEVYNICSGKGRKIREVLDSLLKFAKQKIDVRKDPNRLRLSDLPIVIGNCDKFKQKTGWKPEIPFEQTLEDLLNYWRRQLAAEKVS